MQQGKHTEYEKNLHDELTAATAAAEIAEASNDLGTTTSTKLSDGVALKTSRTPSPKVGSSGGGGGGWPNLSSASSTPTNSTGSGLSSSLGSGLGLGKGSNNINNNFRSDPPEIMR